MLPDKWLRDRTGEDFWDKQAEIVQALARERRVAVASCNAAGKSYMAARAVMWFLANFQPSVCVTTAPTDNQVRNILWQEIHAAYAKGNFGGTLLQKEWKFGPKHYGIGFSTRDYDPDRFQGFHGEWVLVVVDEAAGITPAIWEGIKSITKGGRAKILAIGNPTAIGGEFYNAFSSARWWTTHISAFETPNIIAGDIVIPGLICAEDIEDAKEDWGEDSPIYQARILGRFPQQLEDTLIAISWVEVAGAEVEIRPADEKMPPEVGADIARFGSDESVFVARKGGYAYDIETVSKFDLMEVTGRLRNFANRHGAQIIKCDETGMGGGVVDRLRELGVTVAGMNAGSRAIEPERFVNAGTEWWWNLSKALKSGRLYGPVFSDKRLLGQLTSRKYQVRSDGRIILEPKDQMKKRGLRSPDRGDAIAMAVSVPAPVAQDNYVTYYEPVNISPF